MSAQFAGSEWTAHEYDEWDDRSPPPDADARRPPSDDFRPADPPKTLRALTARDAASLKSQLLTGPNSFAQQVKFGLRRLFK
jgi:hypothetical protein